MCEPSEMDGKSEAELIAESQALADQIEVLRGHRIQISQHLAARRKREEDLRAELKRLEDERSGVKNATVEGQVLEASAGVV